MNLSTGSSGVRLRGIHVRFKRYLDVCADQARCLLTSLHSSSSFDKATWLLLLANGFAFLYAIGRTFSVPFYKSLDHASFPKETIQGHAESRPIQLSDLTGHNPFKPLIITPPRPNGVISRAPVAPPPAPKIPISQKTSYLHLVGIVNGDPIQAIVEDAQTHQTLYVTIGQMIGDVRVDNILTDHIVLTSGDEHMDLVL